MTKKHNKKSHLYKERINQKRMDRLYRLDARWLRALQAAGQLLWLEQKK